MSDEETIDTLTDDAIAAYESDANSYEEHVLSDEVHHLIAEVRRLRQLLAVRDADVLVRVETKAKGIEDGVYAENAELLAKVAGLVGVVTMWREQHECTMGKRLRGWDQKFLDAETDAAIRAAKEGTTAQPDNRDVEIEQLTRRWSQERQAHAATIVAMRAIHELAEHDINRGVVPDNNIVWQIEANARAVLQNLKGASHGG